MRSLEPLGPVRLMACAVGLTARVDCRAERGVAEPRERRFKMLRSHPLEADADHGSLLLRRLVHVGLDTKVALHDFFDVLAGSPEDAQPSVLPVAHAGEPR